MTDTLPTLTKEQVGERFRQCLREADSFIKAKNVSSAKLKLDEAKRLDPVNPYLSAFESRVQLLETSVSSSSFTQTTNTAVRVQEVFSDKLKLQVESEAKSQTLPSWKKFETTAFNRIDDISLNSAKSVKEMGSELLKKYHQQIALDRKNIEAEATQLIEVERRRLQEEFTAKAARQNENVRTVRTEVRREMENNFIRLLELISKQYERKMELLDIHVPDTKTDALSHYKKKMRTYYADGQPTQDQAKKLMELKELLELSYDEHLAVEAEVKEELYMFNLRRKILVGEVTLHTYSKIDELRNQYKITAEQASRAESMVFSRVKKFDVKGRILIVDAEMAHNDMVGNGLNERSYETLVAPNINSALEILNNEFVDLIISDVRFPEGQFDGFKFFTSVQEQFALRRIPFILISSNQDTMLYRCAAQLGVDDILFKPLDVELLNSVIEGKLKRYRELAQI
jgi:CheY-like chemotaxis protein